MNKEQKDTIREEFYGWFTARKGKKDIVDWFELRLQEAYRKGREDLIEEVRKTESVGRILKDNTKEDISCPSPKNPCFCECHLEEKECHDCLCGRHKSKLIKR